MQPQEKCCDNLVSPPVECMTTNRAEYPGGVMRSVVMRTHRGQRSTVFGRKVGMRASCERINKALETPRGRTSISLNFRPVLLWDHYKTISLFQHQEVFRFYSQLQRLIKPSSLATRFIQASGYQGQPTAYKTKAETTTLYPQQVSSAEDQDRASLTDW